MSETYNRDLLATRFDELHHLTKVLRKRRVLDECDELHHKIYDLLEWELREECGKGTALSNEQIVVTLTNLESRINALIEEVHLDRKELLEE